MSVELDFAVEGSEDPPKEFIRGQTLEFLMELPQTIAADFFGSQTIVTTLESKLRRRDNAGTSGLIANLNPEWEWSARYSKIRFLVPETDDFPLGPAEFDVVFTRVSTPVNAVGGFLYNGVGTLAITVLIDGFGITVVGGTEAELLTNLAAAINSSLDVKDYVTATADLATHRVNLVAKGSYEGAEGNLLTTEIGAGTIMTADAATLENGVGERTSTKKYRSLPVRITITDGVT
jgi:hypothetical protein